MSKFIEIGGVVVNVEKLVLIEKDGAGGARLVFDTKTEVYIALEGRPLRELASELLDEQVVGET